VRNARVAATIDGGKVVFSQQRQFSTPDPCGNSNSEDWRVDFFRPDGNVYAAHLILGASICRLIDAEGDSTAANVAYLLSQNASNSIYVDRLDSAGTDTFFSLPSGVDWKRIVMLNSAIGSNAKPLYVLGQSGTTGYRVLRLNGTDLSVDTTFGVNGLYSLDLPTETVSVIDMAVSTAGLFILNKRTIGGSSIKYTIVLKLLHTGAADTTFLTDGFSRTAESGVLPTGTTLYPTSIALDSGNQALIAGSTCPTCSGPPADRLFVAKYTGGGLRYGGFGIGGNGYADYTACQNAGTQTNISGSVQITTRSNGDAILFANGAANSLPGSGADFCAINLDQLGVETARRTHDMYGQTDQFLDLDTSANAAGSVSIVGLSTSSVNRYFVADVNR
jgi:hypothetical protein